MAHSAASTVAPVEQGAAVSYQDAAEVAAVVGGAVEVAAAAAAESEEAEAAAAGAAAAVAEAAGV